MTILFYSLVLIGIGYWYRPTARNSSGFFLASRALSAAEVGVTLTGTAFGGSAILLATLLVYTRGLAGGWFTGSVALGFGVLGFAFARRVRASGAHSLADFLGRHYGPDVRRIASALIVLVEIAFFGLTVKSFALMTTPLFGESRWLLTSEAGFEIFITAVFVIYTLLGGHKAVAATDKLQLAIIFVGLLVILLPLSLWKANFSALPAGHLRLPFSPGAGPLFVLNMLVMMGLSGVIGGDVFSKILSARDGQAARRGALTAAVALGALALAVALLALCARSLLPGLPRPELATLMMARQLLPPILFEVVSLAFLSALLSTGDTVLLTGATVLALDVLKRGERLSIRTVRLLTLAIAGAGLLLALYFGELLEIMKFAYTLLTASVVVPTLATLSLGERRKPARGFVIAAMLAGLLCASLWKGVQLWKPGFCAALDPATIGVGGSALVMLVGLAVSHFVGRDAKDSLR